MAEVTTIKEITSGEATYQVADLPLEIQNLVRFYEIANSKLRSAEEDFVVARAATNALSAELSAAVAKFEAEAKEGAAEGEVVAETAE